MTLHRELFLLASTTAALCALVAAVYWYLSSLPAPESPTEVTASLSYVPEQHILNAIVGIYATQAVMAKVSRLNKWASIWSGLAALAGAASAFLSM
jgi:hypothetical protein